MKTDVFIVTIAVVLGLAAGSAISDPCFSKLPHNDLLWQPHPSISEIESTQGHARPEHYFEMD